MVVCVFQFAPNCVNKKSLHIPYISLSDNVNILGQYVSHVHHDCARNCFENIFQFFRPIPTGYY